MSRKIIVLASVLLGAVGIYAAQQQREGYNNTPFLPGQKWRVHDIDRPYPPEVTPGATVGAPPSDAVVLFDGKDLSEWTMGNGKDCRWKLEDGTMQVAPGTGSILSKKKFGDCQIHLEWQEDEKVTGRGQGRGNSGIYIMGLFELQILDSYRAATYADGQAGAVYGQWPPMVNPIKKPGEWQTYDIIFETPKFKDGKLVSPAFVTLLFNGVMVHNHQKYNGPSAHASLEEYSEIPAEGQILLQDHGPREKLRFRNIWVRPIKGYDTGK